MAESNSQPKMRHPTIIGFMGIPCSGKSTSSKRLAQLLNITCYVELEEADWAPFVKEHFYYRETYGYLSTYNFFRDYRTKLLKDANLLRNRGGSSIIDSYFDKLTVHLLGTSGMDSFLNPNHEDFHKVMQVAQNDWLNLPNVDVLVFLKVSEEFWKRALLSRNRKSELYDIFKAQVGLFKT